MRSQLDTNDSRMLSRHQCVLKILVLSLLVQACDSERSASNQAVDQVEVPTEIVRSRPNESLTDDATTEEIDATQVVSKEGLNDLVELKDSPSTPEKDLLTDIKVAEPREFSKPDKPYCLGPGTKNVEIVNKACVAISNRLASVSNEGCLAANLMLSQCESVEKFPILYSEFAPLNGNQAQGRVLVVGGTHGDELTSVSMVFRWIEKLNQYHTGLFHWHMVPMMNPDGVLKKSATRTNSNGIDLNRNLPSNDWRQNALKYWREKTGESERRYPGQSAASEPETQWLIDEIEIFKPDAIIAVHAPYGLVDFDAPVLNTAPKSLGRLMLNILGTYPGSLGNYAGINLNIPVITLELPHAWSMPSEVETAKLWEDIVRWLRKNVDNPTPASIQEPIKVSQTGLN